MLPAAAFLAALSFFYTTTTAQTEILDADATIVTAIETAIPSGSTDSGSSGSSPPSNHLGVVAETFQQAALLDQICNAAKFGQVDFSSLGLTGEDVWAQLGLDQTLLTYFQTQQCKYLCHGTWTCRSGLG
jgi:hypothetical protein